jgi:hypothetical protein
VAVTHQGTSARASGTTTLAVTLSGVGDNRIALAGRTIKPSTATATDEATWTNRLDATGGTGTQGIDTGPQRIRADSKDISAGEGNPTFDQAGTPNQCVGAVSIYGADAGRPTIEATVSGDDAAHAAGRSASVSAGVNTLAGDLIWAYVASDTDFLAGAWTGAAIGVSTGAVGATTTRLAPGGSSGGQDVGDAIYEATVTTGGTTPTLSLTTNADGQVNCGRVVFVILREPAAAPPLPLQPIMEPLVMP